MFISVQKIAGPILLSGAMKEWVNTQRCFWMTWLGMPVAINKDYIHCVIKDTSYAWLVFNDCFTGRGIQIKLPFSKSK